MKNFKVLEFDSELFGKRIASYTVTGKTDFFTLQKEMKTNNIDLLYLFSPTVIDLIKIEQNLNCSISYQDEKVLYQKKVCPKYKFNQAIYIRTNQWESREVKSIEKLALASSQYSRFFLDSQFPDKLAGALYRIWLKKSLAFDIADEVYLSGNQILSGLLTVKYSKNNATVGLLAIDKEFRGQGVARQLLEHMEFRCIERGMENILIPTQRANVNACKFYIKASFKEVSSTYIYHCWNKYG